MKWKREGWIVKWRQVGGHCLEVGEALPVAAPWGCRAPAVCGHAEEAQGLFADWLRYSWGVVELQLLWRARRTQHPNHALYSPSRKRTAHSVWWTAAARRWPHLPSAASSCPEAASSWRQSLPTVCVAVISAGLLSCAINALGMIVHVCLPAMPPHPTDQLCPTGPPAGDQLVIDADSLRVLKHVKGAHMTFATSVAFSPDEQYIISGEG